MIRVFLLSIFWLWAATASADTDDIPSGEDRIAVLSVGVAAPFSGQLFDAATALRWGNRIERYRLRIRLLTEELEIVQRSHRESTDRQLSLQAASYMREIEGLRSDLRAQALRYETELAEHKNPPFWKQWGFAFGVGVVVTGVLVTSVVVASR